MSVEVYVTGKLSFETPNERWSVWPQSQCFRPLLETIKLILMKRSDVMVEEWLRPFIMCATVAQLGVTHDMRGRILAAQAKSFGFGTIYNFQSAFPDFSLLQQWCWKRKIMAVPSQPSPARPPQTHILCWRSFWELLWRKCYEQPQSVC